MSTHSYFVDGGVLSPEFMASLIADKKWAHCLLSQCFGMSEPVREALLAGEAQWQIQSKKVLSVTLSESP